jgi:hypothetical protein
MEVIWDENISLQMKQNLNEIFKSYLKSIIVNKHPEYLAESQYRRKLDMVT